MITYKWLLKNHIVVIVVNTTQTRFTVNYCAAVIKVLLQSELWTLETVSCIVDVLKIMSCREQNWSTKYWSKWSFKEGTGLEMSINLKLLQTVYENPTNHVSEVVICDENTEQQPSESTVNLILTRFQKLTNVDMCKLYLERTKFPLQNADIKGEFAHLGIK